MTLAAKIDAAIAECDLVPGTEDIRALLGEARDMLVPLTLVRKSPTSPTKVYGPYNFQFDPACVIPGGKVHLCWRGTHEFDAVTGAWRQVTVTNSNGPLVTKYENGGMALVGGLVYRATGAAGATTFPFCKFDPTTSVYTDIGVGELPACYALLHDQPRNRLLGVGASAKSFALPAGPWLPLPLANFPNMNADYAKGKAYARVVISSQGRVGFLAVGNEVHELDPGASVCVHRPTTGTKPPLHSWFVYYEPADCYIVWCNSNTVAGGSAFIPVQKFYRLPRSTWAWEELSVTFPTPGPKMGTAAGNILVADPERQQVIVFIKAGYTEMWTLAL